MNRQLHGPIAIGASALACLLSLNACSRAKDTPPAPVAHPYDMAKAPGALGIDDARHPPVAVRSFEDRKDLHNEARQDVQDNDASSAIAADLGAHPDRLAHQGALCGPSNLTLQARYAAQKGPPSQDLHDLKIACIAKDMAVRARRDHGAGGVKNTNSL